MKKTFGVKIDTSGNIHGADIHHAAREFYEHLREIAGKEARITVETVEKPMKCERCGFEATWHVMCAASVNATGEYSCEVHVLEAIAIRVGEVIVKRLPVAPIEVHGTEWEQCLRTMVDGSPQRCIDVPPQMSEHYRWTFTDGPE